AAFRGQIGNLRQLLEAGANPNLADHKGISPMFVAANGMVVSLLHDFGARLYVFDNEGTPLLEYVENCGHVDAADRIRELQRGEPGSDFSISQNDIDMQSRFEVMNITPNDLVERLDADNGSLQGIIVDGERYRLSQRFLKGLATRMKVPYTIFNLFTPLEVVYRTAERQPDLPLRVTLDRQQKTALGLVEDKGNPLPINQVTQILRNDERLQSLDYSNGVLNAMLDINESWDIPGDSNYKVQISCQVPVDGMGQPEINLATFRQICSNGAVVQEASFRTKMEIKDNSGMHFSRLLRSFNNRSGIEMLHQRLIDANATKASVGELMEVDNLMCKLVGNRHSQMLLREQLLTLGDNPCARYGVASLSSIGEKRRSLLPVGCSVADLLNFTSELETHHRKLLKDTTPLHIFHGQKLAKSFDLEDMYKNSVHARDYHLSHIDFEEASAR
ncbi:MAG: hypothetical protein IJS08_18450, partial [Victivallales bacterium]|nr:hypothetical protein [Victivallales bacterium]